MFARTTTTVLLALVAAASAVQAELKIYSPTTEHYWVGPCFFLFSFFFLSLRFAICLCGLAVCVLPCPFLLLDRMLASFH